MCTHVVLFIQHAMHIHHIVSFVISLAPPHFLTLLNIKSVLILSTTFVWNISHSKKIYWDTAIHVKMSSYKVPVILVRFQWHSNFPNIFLKKILNTKFIKIHPVGVQCRSTEAGGLMDMTKLIVTVCNFANVPKNHAHWKNTTSKQGNIHPRRDPEGPAESTNIALLFLSPWS